MLSCEIKSLLDPTGGNISFGFETVAGTEPSTWVQGSWSGSWDTVKRVATALTPTLPSATAAAVLTVGTYYVWVKLQLGSEVVVMYFDQLVVE